MLLCLHVVFHSRTEQATCAKEDMSSFARAGLVVPHAAYQPRGSSEQSSASGARNLPAIFEFEGTEPDGTAMPTLAVSSNAMGDTYETRAVQYARAPKYHTCSTTSDRT